MSETVKDYVIAENEAKEKRETQEKTKPKPKTKKKGVSKQSSKNEVKETEIDPEMRIEISRKKDILASVAMTFGLEEYVGENISAVDIRKMSDNEVESLFKVYEEKSGQELMKDGMGIIIDGLIKTLSLMLTFDDVDSLKKDLMNNKQLGRRFGKYAARISEEYGDVVAMLRVVLDVAKHIVVSKDESFESKEISIESPKDKKV